MIQNYRPHRIILLASVAAASVLLACGGCAVQKADNTNNSNSVATNDTTQRNDASSHAANSQIIPSNGDSEAESKNNDDSAVYLTGRDSINVFSDEGLTNVSAELPSGTKVIVERKNNESLFAAVSIRTDDGKVKGFVMNKDITNDKAAVTSGIRARVKADGGANVYESPDAESGSVGWLNDGDEMTIIAKTSGGYWRIMTDSLVVGYVRIDFIDTDEKEPQSLAAQSSQTGTDNSVSDNGVNNTNNSENANSISPENQDNTQMDIPSTSSEKEDSTSAAGQPQSDDANGVLNNAVAAARSEMGGNWSAAYIDLSSGSTSSVNNSSMQAASLIKLYIMGAIYEDYDSYAGKQGNLDSLLDSMITVSDNTAANTLVGLLGNGDSNAGMNAVTAYAHQKGYSQTSMGRLLLQSNENGDNYTSALDCANFLSAVYNGQLPHSGEMKALLSRQTRTSKIPAGVPVKTANKTGELADVQNDAAIVFAGKPYVLCVLSENVPYSAADAIATLSASVYSGTQ
ncbi:MAG: serine hydrolase [Clostridia bacterium]|nr:serine hydrolase [Clostridia bacterium]